MKLNVKCNKQWPSLDVNPLPHNPAQYPSTELAGSWYNTLQNSLITTSGYKEYVLHYVCIFSGLHLDYFRHQLSRTDECCHLCISQKTSFDKRCGPASLQHCEIAVNRCVRPWRRRQTPRVCTRCTVWQQAGSINRLISRSITAGDDLASQRKLVTTKMSRLLTRPATKAIELSRLVKSA